MLSIVVDLFTPGNLLVRARRRGDIERAFPDAVVSVTPAADYRYRVSLPREAVAAAMSAQVEAITYRNFKASTPDHDRHDAYLRVWGAMHAYQQDEPLSPARPAPKPARSRAPRRASAR